MSAFWGTCRVILLDCPGSGSVWIPSSTKQVCVQVCVQDNHAWIHEYKYEYDYPGMVGIYVYLYCTLHLV